MTAGQGSIASRILSRAPRPCRPDSGRADQKVFHAVILSACAGLLAASVVLRADAEGVSFLGYRWPFSCGLYEMLGVRCTLCGMSRSFCSLGHGDIVAGFKFHPLGPFAFALFGLEIVYRIYALALHPAPISVRLSRVHAAVLICLCVAVLCHWLVYLGGLIP